MSKEGSLDMALALCTGCSIGTSVDTDKLVEAAAEAIQGISCLKHDCLCSEAGLAELNKMTLEKGVKRLAVAACSPRVKNSEFELDGLQVERINLREQVAWVMEPGHEDTQMCAEDQTRMVLAKLESISDIKPYVPEQLSSDILVLGGGIAGLTSALEGARAAYRVHLVERSDRLGGYAGRIYKMLPGSEDNATLKEPDLPALVKEVEEHPGVEVYLESNIQSISGEPGNFTVALENKMVAEFRVGSVVTATGWKPYNTEKLAHLGYGSERVKTLEEFEHYVQEKEVPDRVLFIMCAGSRDENHLAYCSSYCCSAALKQALYVRELNPRAEVYIIYRDIRTTGFQEEFYKMVQADLICF